MAGNSSEYWCYYNNSSLIVPAIREDMFYWRVCVSRINLLFAN